MDVEKEVLDFDAQTFIGRLPSGPVHSELTFRFQSSFRQKDSSSNVLQKFVLLSAMKVKSLQAESLFCSRAGRSVQNLLIFKSSVIIL